MDSLNKNRQTQFWSSASEYILENSEFDISLGISAWEKMLDRVDASAIRTVLELGSNIGRNIAFLTNILKEASFSALDVNPQALSQLKRHLPDVSTYHSDIQSFPDSLFDLVFTCGVLIHINPVHLNQVVSKMEKLSTKYIIICEYFNRTLVNIPYRGREDLLWKQDFGRLFLESGNFKILDYGFLWGHEYDLAGFDDITYWLFERVNNSSVD